MEQPGEFYIKTPLIRSERLSKKLGVTVWLKLENIQNSHSFKMRGISNLCKKAAEKGCSKFVSSSGGNAGAAATYCARLLNKPIMVIVPESTPAVVVKNLEDGGADAIVFGKVWDEANKKALEIVSSTPGAQYVSPFDDPLIWEGNSTMIEEIKEQLHGNVPDAIVVAVGGGGLLCGVCQGLHKVGWGHVPVVAMETAGCDSLNCCIRDNKWSQLNDITSAAKCLGARRVCHQAYQWLSQHNIISCVVDDQQAASACLQFADDHHMMVELSCGAALAAAYGDKLEQLQRDGSSSQLSWTSGNLVLVVCGGSGVNVDMLLQWKNNLL